MKTIFTLPLLLACILVLSHVKAQSPSNPYDRPPSEAENPYDIPQSPEVEIIEVIEEAEAENPYDVPQVSETENPYDIPQSPEVEIIYEVPEEAEAENPYNTGSSEAENPYDIPPPSETENPYDIPQSPEVEIIYDVPEEAEAENPYNTGSSEAENPYNTGPSEAENPYDVPEVSETENPYSIPEVSETENPYEIPEEDVYISEETDIQSNSYDILIGDFNGDRRDDYITQKKGDWANEGDSVVELFISKGDGEFDNFTLSSDFILRTNDFNLYVGDFNGDGYDDLLRQEKGGWAADARFTAFLLISDGTGGFSSYTLSEDFQLNGDFTNLYIGDFNGDGKDDIFRQAKGTSAKGACVLLANDDDTFFDSVDIPPDFELNGDQTILYVGDFNGDQKDDIFRQEKADYDNDEINTANVLFSNGNGTFQKVVLSEDFSLKGDLTVLHIGDFNGDGNSDVLRREKGVWATDNIRGAELLLSNGNGDFQRITLSEDFNLKADNTNVYVGDFNGDGKDDFFRRIMGGLSAYDVTSPTDVFISTGDNFEKFAFQEDQSADEGEDIRYYVGDFNGDNLKDLLRYGGVNNIRIYYSNGDGTYV